MSRIEDSMGISYRQLDHWSRCGYLRPDGGDGVQRIWPHSEIRIGRMMSRLIAIGLTPETAAEYARAAVENNVTMLLELRDGKLRVSGAFARAVRRSLVRNQQIRDSRNYGTTSEEAKAS
jgi:DNA-binding transcriptional MerR regulator